ncbi:hypothetical protein D3C72_1077310 [compost metagenome]
MRQAVRADHHAAVADDALDVLFVHREIDGAAGRQLFGQPGGVLAFARSQFAQVDALDFRTGLRPGHDDLFAGADAARLQDGGRRRIGIHVHAQRLVGARAVIQRQRFDGAAVVVLAGDLVVRQDGRHVGRAADQEGFFHGVANVVGFVAQVGGVQAAPSGQGLGHADHFLGAGVHGGGVVQARGQARGAGRHGLVQRPPHGCDLALVGRAVQPVHGRYAQAGMAHQRQAVDGGGRGVQRVGVVLHAGVEFARVLGQQVQRGRHHIARRAHRRQADAAVAGDHGGDALADFGPHQGRAQQRAVIVGMAINEARRHHLAGGVQAAPRAPLRAVANGRNALALDGDVGAAGGAAQTVGHLAADDDDVVFLRVGMRGHEGLRLGDRRPAVCRAAPPGWQGIRYSRGLASHGPPGVPARR